MTRLVSYCGDDFTGSTDVMEALASHDVSTVLFTRVPSGQEFAPFADYEAVGLATTSRSQTTRWMDEHLPQAFTWLKGLEACFCHYKVCSTFDSSPAVGSIGHATGIGLRVFGQKRTTLVVGAPQLKRYTFAGHLFADFRGTIYRIDRHPVMSVHPVTPMDESDLLIHLARQAKVPVDIIDVHDQATQKAAGLALISLPPENLPFVVGSSGVEYALMAALGKTRAASFASVAPVDRLLVVSGSVSPTTERQIAFAIANGFEALAADPLELARGRSEAVLNQARAILARGASPLIYTASGPATDRGEALNAVPEGRVALSRELGRLAKTLVQEFGLKRLVIAGGDTSSHALSELNIHALTTRYPLL
ncbi:MAG: four-carbon acid sugar kinase family protein, partial [Rhizobiales bacterium]|nr:four-carbon acid sugar kinase family protein [Hyphomicrobiales bacterium]